MPKLKINIIDILFSRIIYPVIYFFYRVSIIKHYSEMFCDCRFRANEILDVRSSVPITTKADIRKRDYRTLRNRWISKRETAGTTGVPTVFAFTKSDISRMIAVRKYCLQYYNIEIGERELRLWGRPNSGLKSRLKNLILNRLVINDVRSDKVWLTHLRKKKFSYIYGYSSLVLRLAKAYQESAILAPNPKIIICTAECITSAQKKFISKVFSAPVIEEYGASEFDIIGFECIHGNKKVVNPYLILENTPDGALITDTSRITFPMIRYALGDKLEIGESSCDCLGAKTVVKSVVGRSTKQLILMPDGKRTHAVQIVYLLEGVMQKFDTVFWFKLYQKKNLSLDLEVYFFDKDALKKSTRIIYEMRRVISTQFSSLFFDIRVLDDIPIENNSKYDYFISFVDDSFAP